MVFTAIATWSQPQSIWYTEYDAEAADVNGTLYVSGVYDLSSIDDTGNNYQIYVGQMAEHLADINGILYYTLYDDERNEASIWRWNGNDSDAELIQKFNTTFYHISMPVQFDNVVYFGFQDKLYRSDGTEAGTSLVKDLNSDADQGALSLLAFQNKLYINFRRDAADFQLWQSTGTETSTSLIQDFEHIELLKPAGNVLYFVADNGVTGNELWKVDISGNVTLVRDLNPGGADSFSRERTIVSSALNDHLFFSTQTPAATWRTTGTPEGTVQLKNLEAYEMVQSGGQVYFTHENKLWKTDGTAQAFLVKEFEPAAAPHGYLTTLAAFNNTIFFAEGRKALWQSDGTASGTILISDHFDDQASISKILKSGSAMYYLLKVNSDYGYSTTSLFRYEPQSVWIPSLQLVDASTESDLRALSDDDVLYTDQQISIRADASLATARVIFYLNNSTFRNERERPFAIAGDNSGNYSEWIKSPGAYQIKVVPYSASGTPGTPLTLNVDVRDRSAGCGSGNIVREYWTNVSGSAVSTIPTHLRATGSQVLNAFEAPLNQGSNYGARIRGFICPPSTGNYTFWIASNDNSELWLSTDESPANKRRIAFVTGSTNSQQWDKFTSQKSLAIPLVAGQRYFIEALHKQGAGTDNLAVGWQLPDGQMERPIQGNRLSPFSGNSFPVVSILSPVEGQTFTAPATISIALKTGDSDGYIETIDYFAGTKKINRYFDYGEMMTWENVEAGIYKLTARVTDNMGATTTSAPVNIIVNGECSASGTIRREIWRGVSGSTVSNIPVNNQPSDVTEIPFFEAPQNNGTNYGARVRGFICAPSSGNYIFWIASNDHSELWLSNDDNPANKAKIASVTGATEPRQWNKYASQRSVEISLIAGKKYYIEALHKQGSGSDNLAVGWQLPDGTMERPIGGNRLSPYMENSEAMSRVIYPPSGTVDLDPLVVKLKIEPAMGPARYTIELNPKPDFSGTPMLINSVEDYQTAYIINNLQHSTTYYTRVKSDITGYGLVSHFTTRDLIPQQRLWGLTTAGGVDNLGTLFSFSIDSLNFVKHHDKRILYYEGDEYGVEENFRGSLVAGPEGVFYGHAEYVYDDHIFTLTAEAEVEWWPGFFFENGNLILASDNHIFTTSDDFMEGGSIDRHDPETRTFGNRYSPFNARENGSNPGARLFERNDGYLYGTARSGGFNEGGVIYRMRHDGTGFQVIHHFEDDVMGFTPYCGVTGAGEFLYGTTAYGGNVEQSGTVFKIKPDGTGFKKLHDFDGARGRNPMGEVIIHNGVIYGMTTKGGDADAGTVYRINTDGSGFSVLHEFNGVDGKIPSGALVRDASGKLYGMTRQGGVENLGVIFMINSGGTGFTKLFDFTQASGGLPNGSLFIREDIFSPPAASALAMAREENLDITIHPNPTTESFSIHVKSPANEPIKVIVSDQYGQLISTYDIAEDTPLQFGGELKRGLYIMKVMQGEEIAMKRMVKK